MNNQEVLFNKERYNKYIKMYETSVKAIYVLFAILGAIPAIASVALSGLTSAVTGASTEGLDITLLIIGILIGLVLAHALSMVLKIKIEEMKWKVDIHESLVYHRIQ